MQHTITEIYKIYDATDKTIIIPVYQRNYDWTIKHCSQLFDDLEKLAAEKERNHFFGIIVGKPDGSWKWIVIDGQQRLTTISLLMLALTHAIDQKTIDCNEEGLAKRIRRSYLLINDGHKVKLKLKPVKDDHIAYQNLFKDEQLFIESSNITANYRFFMKRISSSNFRADQLWDAICRLEVLVLDLKEQDNPQQIFESLNSTGLELSESDKIRNLVLMGLDDDNQERLYNDYWNQMERAVKFRTDWFIRWYLVTRTSKTPKEDDVYEEFKTYLSSSGKEIETVLADMLDYSIHCREITTASTGHTQVDAALRRFNLIMGDVFLPFLMRVLDDVKNDTIDNRDFLQIIEILESYLFRRVTASIPANALNKIFATAYGEIRKLRKNEEEYADILAHLLLKRDGGGRFPRNEEFRESFKTRNMYNILPKYRKYLFECLENSRSNDSRDIANALDSAAVSVEHVMPQTLTDAWRQELGPNHEEVHAKWINRIGNLTITGYNSSYSNASFERKLSMENGFACSPYRINDFIRNQTRWGAEEIEERSNQLSDIALDYWRFPETNFKPPAVVLPTEPLGTDTSFQGREIVEYEFSGVRETVVSWSDMLTKVLRVLAEQYRRDILGLAKDMPLLHIVDGSTDQLPQGVAPVDPGLAVFTSNNTNTKMRFLRNLFEKLGIDPEDLVFKLRPIKDISKKVEEKPETPHSAVLRFLPRFEELAAQNVTPADTESLRKEFKEAFAGFASKDAPHDLKGKLLTEYSDTAVIAEAEAEQIIAAITATIQMTTMFDPLAVHQRIADGTMTNWLRRIEELEPQ